MLQWRKRGSTDPMYNPQRDVAWLFPDVIKAVNGLLEDYSPKDPVLGPILQTGEISMDDLGEAAGAYCRFMNLAHQELDETVESGLTKAGWFVVKPLARLAYLNYVGTAMTATFFRGAREVATVGQERPAAVIAQVIWTVKRLVIFSRMTSWQRFCYRWLRPYRKWLWKRHKIKKD